MAETRQGETFGRHGPLFTGIRDERQCNRLEQSRYPTHFPPHQACRLAYRLANCRLISVLYCSVAAQPFQVLHDA
jgi:hypothetical protein